jgi:phosphoribosylglycinamide formyltransferase-1
VLAEHTVETLAADVLQQEHIIYPRAIKWFCEGRLQLKNERILFDNKPLPAPLELDKLESPHS